MNGHASNLPRRNWQVWSIRSPASVVRCMLGKHRGAKGRELKKHRDACNKGGGTWKSATVEHQWDQQHQVNCDETRVLDRAARPVQLKVKEALYIERIPTNNRLNRDRG